MTFMALLTKELKELARSYKLLFVPLAFVVLGLGQPLVYKMMPMLMKSAGNMPEGAVINLPTPPPGQIVASIFSQYNQMGILVLTLVAMGAIAGERLSGVAATVLTKPVGRGEYLGAKAVAYSLLATISLVAGTLLTAYYTAVLFGPVDWVDTLTAAFIYLPNLLLAVTVTLLFSTFMASPLAAGGAALVAQILLHVVPKYLGKVVASLAQGALSEGAVLTASGTSLAVGRGLFGVMVLVLLFLVTGAVTLRRQEI